MACLRVRGTHQQLNRMADVSPSAKPFTPKQGQYLAFIQLYTRLHRRPPAETDMQEYFRVSPRLGTPDGADARNGQRSRSSCHSPQAPAGERQIILSPRRWRSRMARAG